MNKENKNLLVLNREKIDKYEAIQLIMALRNNNEKNSNFTRST